MRTLKKTLCLVLCLAMMAGLCVISASAAFTDAEQINYKEAVAVLSGVGVINGFAAEDGSYYFQPQGTLTRAQACKIITYVLRDQDIKGACSFTDCQGHWAESAIAYCAGKGIVDGYGDGTFGPDDTLTGYAFCKMLLTALGYDAKAEGMTGENWELGVGTLVKETELAATIKGFDGTKDITREEACELAFRAMTVLQTVEYNTPGITIKTSDVEITTGASKAKETEKQLMDKFALELTDKEDLGKDAYGRPCVKEWTNGKEGTAKVVYYSQYAKADWTFVQSVYGKENEWAKDVKAAYAKEKGLKAEDITIANEGDYAEWELYPGVVDEFTVSANGKTLTLLTEWWYEIDKVAKVEKAGKDAKYSYDITFVDDWKKTDKDFTIDLAKGDVIAVPTLDGTTYITADAVKLTAKTGKISSFAKDDSYVVVGGEKLVFDDCFWRFDGCSFSFDNEYTYYVSPLGFLGAAELYKEAEAEHDYLVAYNIASQSRGYDSGNAGETDLLGKTTGAADAISAKAVSKVLTPDCDVVMLNAAIKQNATDKNFYYVGKAYELINEGKPMEVKDSKVISVNLHTASKYYLDENGDAVIDSFEIAKEMTVTKAGYKVTIGGDEYVANSATVLNVYTIAKDKEGAPVYDKVTKASYKGYKNFVAAEGFGYKTVDVKTGYLTEINIFVNAEDVKPETKPVAALKAVGDLEKDGYKHTFLVNGEEVSYYYSKVLAGKFFDLTITNGKLTDAKLNESGTAYSVLDVDEGNFFVGKQKDASPEVVEFLKTTNVYDISGKTLTLGKGVEVTVFADGEAKTMSIFITGETPKAAN